MPLSDLASHRPKVLALAPEGATLRMSLGILDQKDR